MLDLQPASARSRTSRRRFGLALAGGGPFGAFYQVGALHALAEACEGLDLNDLEMYTGVSSGAMVAAGLANGFDTTDIGVVFIQNASQDFPVEPSLFLQPAFGEYARRLTSVPGLLADVVAQYVRNPRKRWVEALDALGRLLPTGLCDSRPLEQFFARLFSAPGRTNDFRELEHRLYIVATELNGGYSVRFGEPGLDAVPISRAIQASTALPGLYPPVEIDGHTYVDGALMRTMNASILLDAGMDLAICVNPLVAFDASSTRARDRAEAVPDLTRGGLPVVLSQTFRAMIQSRMQVGMATYERRYPRTDMLLIEPDRGDEELFFKNVFSYADRHRLAEHAYRCMRRDLRASAPAAGRMLARHGLQLKRDVLEDKSRSFDGAVRERRRRLEPVTGPLHRALDRLESAVRDGLQA